MSRIRVLLVQPELARSGGGTVAAWLVQSLAREFDTTVLTWDSIDAASVDRFCGTSLASARFEIERPPRALRAAVDAATAFDRDPWSILRWALLMRLARREARRFDAVLAANNEADLGPTGIQYIHYPYLHRALRRGGARSSWHQRLRPWRLISGFRVERMKRQVTLVNSDWTGAVVRSHYGIEPITVYPPTHNDFPRIPWSEREDGFVCIGRIAAEKRFEVAAEIVGRVRERHPPAHLHIVGVAESPRRSWRYREAVRRLASERPWLTLHEELTRAELTGLVARHRFGIHAAEEEHFGIAVAEMVHAGCVVFTPNGGGQVEITRDTRLAFDGVDDAVEKILAVLEDGAKQDGLRAHLARQSAELTPERFGAEIATIVRRHAEGAARCS
jgi:glycosyltransferase involved in cell wall biosynthesis